MEWQRARLIPVSGIDSEKEAEVRATSALLAVMSAVRPFSKALLDDLGASRATGATVETFTECIFEHGGQRVRPDGLITVKHGSKAPWTALVEVKTGESLLEADQLNTYWAIARERGYQAVISISSQIAPASGVHPTVGLKVRASSPIRIHHFSWARILTEAIMQKVHRGVDDPDQAWILGELIRYLQHPRSGALQFRDMGSSWVDVRSAARNGTLNKRDKGASDVSERWLQLLRFAALRLGGEVGQPVDVVQSNGRKLGSQAATALCADLVGSGSLGGGLRVPDTAGDIGLTADLRAQLLNVSITIDAPRDRGARGQVSWLLGQLADAPGRLVVERWPKNARTASTAAELAAVREDRSTLLDGDGREALRFRLVLRGPMGTGRRATGRSPSFVDSVLSILDEFYEDVVQHLTAWQPPAPKRRSLEDSNPQASSEESPAVSVAMGSVE